MIRVILLVAVLAGCSPLVSDFTPKPILIMSPTLTVTANVTLSPTPAPSQASTLTETVTEEPTALPTETAHPTVTVTPILAETSTSAAVFPTVTQAVTASSAAIAAPPTLAPPPTSLPTETATEVGCGAPQWVCDDPNPDTLASWNRLPEWLRWVPGLTKDPQHEIWHIHGVDSPPCPREGTDIFNDLWWGVDAGATEFTGGASVPLGNNWTGFVYNGSGTIVKVTYGCTYNVNKGVYGFYVNHFVQDYKPYL